MFFDFKFSEHPGYAFRARQLRLAGVFQLELEYQVGFGAAPHALTLGTGSRHGISPVPQGMKILFHNT